MEGDEKIVVAEARSVKVRDNDGLHRRRGIWHYKLNIGGRWKEFSTKTTNYQKARTIRQDAVKAQEEGRLPTDFSKLNFKKASELWLEERKALVAPKTYRIDKERSNALTVDFGGIRLCDFTNDLIRQFQTKRVKQVSPRTVNLETKVLRMILRRGRMWGRIADDFKPLRENKHGPGRALTPDQEKALFKVAASKPAWNVAFYAAILASNTSARGGELKGLRLGDIDLMQQTLRIERSSTKTDAGARIVPLNDYAMWACARLLERAQNLGASEPTHYLFPAARFRHTKQPDSARGSGFDFTKPMQTWRTAWRSLTKEAKLPGLRFHDLRHHCITKLAEAGVPDQTLMAIAGHVSREMLEHYSHIRMQAKRDAVALLQRGPKERLDGIPVQEPPTG